MARLLCAQRLELFPDSRGPNVNRGRRIPAMGELANSVAEVFAAVLRAVGFVGTPRKRAAIRDDLALLRELDEFPGGEFGPGNAPHIWLTAHIYQQVGEFAGLDFRT